MVSPDPFQSPLSLDEEENEAPDPHREKPREDIQTEETTREATGR